MQIRKRAFAIGGAAALIAAGLGGSMAANGADAAPHTFHLRFIAHSDRNINFTQRTFAGTEIDRNHGRRVGFDLISGEFDPATKVVTIDVSVARRGGLLHAKVHSTSSTDFVGRVTGGAGRFKGARGKVTAHNLTPQGNRTRVLVAYTLP